MDTEEEKTVPCLSSAQNGEDVSAEAIDLKPAMDPSTRCGILSLTPNCLQIFANMHSFSLYYGLCTFVTSAVTVYLTSQVTTLEKQYGLSSSESGVLLSMNDIGFLMFVLIFSHFTRYSNKPKILGICVLIFGVTSILSALPHFINPGYLANTTDVSQGGDPISNISEATGDRMLCSPEAGKHTESAADVNYDKEKCTDSRMENKSWEKQWVVALISIGMFLQGSAKAPRLPLGCVFIEDNVIHTKTGLYAGIVSFMGMCGPTLAFVAGAWVSRVYVTLEEPTFSRKDPRWVGAWWLGFILFGLAAILLSGPVFMFPRKMVIRSKNCNTQQSASLHRGQVDNTTATLKKVKDIPRTFRRLLTNFNLMSILIAGSIDMLTAAGGVAFAPKFLEVFFGLSVFKANMLYGLTTFVAGSIGTLAGGILATKLKLSLRGCLKVIILARLTAGVAVSMMLFVNCPPVTIEGLPTLRLTNVDDSLSSTCQECVCDRRTYFPVCASDGRNYLSPCVAGCSAKVGPKYTNCSCVGLSITRLPGSDEAEPLRSEFTAVPGLCSVECSLLTVFIVSQVVSSFMLSLSSIPQLVACLGSVEDRDKALCIGMLSFVYSLIGWMLGPVIFGHLVDSTCRFWNTSCSQKESCAVYDVIDLRDKLHGTAVGVRGVSVIIYGLCLGRLLFSSDQVGKGRDRSCPETSPDTAEMTDMLPAV